MTNSLLKVEENEEAKSSRSKNPLSLNFNPFGGNDSPVNSEEKIYIISVKENSLANSNS